MSDNKSNGGSVRAAVLSFFTALIILMVSYYTTSVLDVHLKNFSKLEEDFRQLRMQDSYISDICMGVSSSNPNDAQSMHRIIYHLQQKEVLQVNLLGDIWGISYLFPSEHKNIDQYINWSIGLYNYIYKHGQCPVSMCSQKELENYETSLTNKFPIDSISLIKRVIWKDFQGIKNEQEVDNSCIDREIK